MRKMTKFPIGHVILGTLLSFFLIVQTSICDSGVNNSHVLQNDKSSVTLNNTTPILQNDIAKNESDDKNKKSPNATVIQINSTANAANIKHDTNQNKQENNVELLKNKPHSHSPELDSGAVIRAFYVFVGLSVIVVAYLIFRSFRLRNNPAQMVKKYGVLAHKQDIEMRPLPLDDDDDDDDTTVFDASKLPLHSKQTA